MRFAEHQQEARRQTAWLLCAFVLTVALLVLAINAALAAAWGLTWGFWAPGAMAYPRLFFEVNTGVALGFVLGGWWLETSRLKRDGGVRLAQRLGARPAHRSGSHAEHRFCNIVEEMALAAGLARPAPMVLARDASINAFAAGWDGADAALVVTQGALEHLTRDELQGLVAHELSHIGEGDARLNLRLVGMVFGLEMIYRMGDSMTEPDVNGRPTALVVPGVALKVVGWLGWIAGHALQAAVSRQREFLADARAVQWTRSRDSLGGVLRKVLAQHQAGVDGQHQPATVQHLLLVGSECGHAARWLNAHPPLAERIYRVYGRRMGPLPLNTPSPDWPADAAAQVSAPDWTLS
jgi:Zn-dependent protease with chaperone function